MTSTYIRKQYIYANEDTVQRTSTENEEGCDLYFLLHCDGQISNSKLQYVTALVTVMSTLIDNSRMSKIILTILNQLWIVLLWYFIIFKMTSTFLLEVQTKSIHRRGMG